MEFTANVYLGQEPLVHAGHIIGPQVNEATG